MLKSCHVSVDAKIDLNQLWDQWTANQQGIVYTPPSNAQAQNTKGAKDASNAKPTSNRSGKKKAVPTNHASLCFVFVISTRIRFRAPLGHSPPPSNSASASATASSKKPAARCNFAIRRSPQRRSQILKINFRASSACTYKRFALPPHTAFQVSRGKFQS
jgi:hypothetical protein